MNFGQAVELTKQGKVIARNGWNGKGMFVFDFYHSVLKMKEDTEFAQELYDVSELEGVIEVGTSELTYKLDNFLLLKTAGNTVIPWNGSQADMLAEDWIEIEAELDWCNNNKKISKNEDEYNGYINGVKHSINLINEFKVNLEEDN